MRNSLSPTKLAFACFVVAGTAGLAGCDTMSDAMGIGTLPPDEYAVAPRRPLAMPPDYELRPPQPGAAGPTEINATGVAAQAVANSGQGAPQPASASGAIPDQAPPSPAEPQRDGRILSTTPAPADPVDAQDTIPSRDNR